MPLKSAAFYWVKYRPEVVAAALTTFEKYLEPELRTGKGTHRTIDLASGVHWEHDTDEEFFADYRQPCTYAQFRSVRVPPQRDIIVDFFGERTIPFTRVTVRLPERYQVEEVFEVFASRVGESLISRPKEAPRIFVGHGGSNDWRELADHLRDKQKLEVIAFESDPRAGLIAKDVLLRLAREASFALLVHTAEDEQADSTMRARQNVVHETGFFQAKLGFERAIILREDSCEAFTNTGGLQEIRYAVGRIKETFGDVVATIRREFPDMSRS